MAFYFLPRCEDDVVVTHIQQHTSIFLRVHGLAQAEQAARRKAEELLAKSTESEASLKAQLDAEVKKRSKEQKQLAAQREEVRCPTQHPSSCIEVAFAAFASGINTA